MRVIEEASNDKCEQERERDKKREDQNVKPERLQSATETIGKGD